MKDLIGDMELTGKKWTNQTERQFLYSKFDFLILSTTQRDLGSSIAPETKILNFK